MDLPLSLAVLDQRVAAWRHFNPLPPDTQQSIDENMRIRITYASNAIEGNTLTLAETHLVLQGFTVGGKPLRDHLEAIDHAEAWDAMQTWARGDAPITPWLLRSLHAVVMRRSRPDIAGLFRTVPVAIHGSNLVPPDPILVPELVESLFHKWDQTKGHPVLVRAMMHAQLMAIHPFVDGNGRTGRLLLNLWLLRHHYPPALLEPDQRGAYYSALQAADMGDDLPITQVVIQSIERTIDLTERILHPPADPPSGSS
ncbi:MAG: hypothetical protein C7B47_08345 [Sulfobacillus thermosulfidooxidans]|uniref:Fido domain-containing protein n=1 Tax=Sulfobacillus thermosulfidooxidans TaxID=28034 RepID=A0A2T2WYP8_SULTH|nr:MAG: hypothetical protein C7B47_08345 [Sulfobacillus thermosulfidooxidans]